VTVNGKMARFSYTDEVATIVATDGGDGLDVVVGSVER
jgi:hypothetical protein